MKYFVVYRRKYEGRNYDSDWIIVNEVTEDHPVDDLLRRSHERNQGYKYNLLFWSEIPDDVGGRFQAHVQEHGPFGA